MKYSLHMNIRQVRQRCFGWYSRGVLLTRYMATQRWGRQRHDNFGSSPHLQAVSTLTSIYIILLASQRQQINDEYMFSKEKFNEQYEIEYRRILMDDHFT